MNYNILLYCVIGLLFSPLITYSQDWGDISDGVLQMTQFDPDPEADAVIMFDIAEIRITPNYDMEMTRHRRLKILTEAGKEYATIKIRFWHEDEIRDIEAICYHPDGEEFEVDSDEIYDEGAEKWRQKVFAIPGVEVGTVIEYSYELFSNYIDHLEPWVFQSQDYTILSRLSVFIPAGYNYGALNMNLDQYKLVKEQENVFSFGTGGPEKVTKFTWTMNDLPGIKKEPYMTTVKDYFAKILFQVKSYDRRNIHQTFAKEWGDVAKMISTRYEPLFRQDGGIEEFVEEIVASIKDPKQRAKKIYDYVRTEIKSSKNNGIFGPDLKEPDDVFETKTGSITEKNLLVINMLRQADLNANPLLISTRNNGKINSDWVQYQQFNRVLAYLRINKTSWYLDTKDKFCPFGSLTPSSDVAMGLLVKDDQGVMILLQSQKLKSKTKINTKVKVTNQGDIVASTEFKFEGYDAVVERNQLMEGEVEDYFTNKIEDVFKDAILDSFTCSNIDSLDKTLILTVDYRLPGYIQILDHLQYFNPPYFTAVDKNPFIRQTRNFPVEYSFLYTESEAIKIHLPNGLSLSEVPNRIKTNMKEVVYNKVYFTMDDGIECRRGFGVIKKRVDQIKYKDLRLLYDDIVESDQTQIVLIQNKPN